MILDTLHKGDWLIVEYSQMGNQFAVYHGAEGQDTAIIRRWMTTSHRFGGVTKVPADHVLHRLSGPPDEFKPPKGAQHHES